MSILFVCDYSAMRSLAKDMPRYPLSRYKRGIIKASTGTVKMQERVLISTLHAACVCPFFTSSDMFSTMLALGQQPSRKKVILTYSGRGTK